jgi:ABC-type glycerol-3-phosphate transport system substrate-binding protein
MPITDSENPSVYWGNDQGHFISSAAEDPQAAWLWIKFLTENAASLSGVPARKSVAESPEWEARVGKDIAEAYRVALSRVVRQLPEQTTYNPISWPLYTWRQEIVSAMFKGEDYAKTIAQSQEKAEDYLACMATVDRDKLTDTELNDEVNRCAKEADPNGPWAPSGGGGG